MNLCKSHFVRRTIQKKSTSIKISNTVFFLQTDRMDTHAEKIAFVCQFPFFLYKYVGIYLHVLRSIKNLTEKGLTIFSVSHSTLLCHSTCTLPFTLVITIFFALNLPTIYIYNDDEDVPSIEMNPPVVY